VDAVEAVGVEVVRKPAAAPDPRDEHGVLGAQLLGGQQLLRGGEHGVVAAPGAPPRDGAFEVVERELALVVHRRGEE
jgi:hypothetical protein